MVQDKFCTADGHNSLVKKLCLNDTGCSVVPSGLASWSWRPNIILYLYPCHVDGAYAAGGDSVEHTPSGPESQPSASGVVILGHPQLVTHKLALIIFHILIEEREKLALD